MLLYTCKLNKSKEELTMNYEVYELDVWGNTKEGFTVNQWENTCIGIEVEIDTTNRQLFRRLREAGFIIPKGCLVNDVSEDMIEISLRNGKPYLNLVKK